MKKEPCIIGVYCHRHGFIHGAEAEELRERFEEWIKHTGKLRVAVQSILDDVDARDSLAYREFQESR